MRKHPIQFDLFNQELSESPNNMIPHDGFAKYLGPFIKIALADTFFEKLMQEIRWQNDEVNLFGKRIITKRKVAWVADPPFEYTYSSATKHAVPWSKALLELKELIEKKAETSFNSCLLNLYHDGSDGMGWHSDNEKELEKHGVIASVSLGDERKFSFKHKTTKEVISLDLQHGSLLLMLGPIQDYWLHSLPKTKRSIGPRINLTFRTFIG